MILKKIGDEYKLYGGDDSCIATTQESPHKRLSKQNCDEIFGVINIIDLAERNSKYSEEDYIEGFNKAMELNKDKLFTEFDIIKAFEYGWNQRHFDKTDENELREIQKRFIQSLQQPTEIEVEIEMEYQGFEVDGKIKESYLPKIDENGCLILRKK
jgi:hypothetical protein